MVRAILPGSKTSGRFCHPAPLANAKSARVGSSQRKAASSLTPNQPCHNNISFKDSSRYEVQRVCTMACSFVRELFAVAIPGWIALKCATAAHWMRRQSLQPEILNAVKSTKRGAMILPFASAVAGAKGPSELFIMLNQAVYHFVNLYLLFLFIRVILSWFPAFDWERTIWRELRQVTDPYLNIFTGIVPPLLGAIDLTPLLGFFVLQALKGYLTVYTDDDIEAWW